MKKYLIPAGLLCTAALAGTIAVHKKRKKETKDNIMFYPIGKYVLQTNEEQSSLEVLIQEADLIVSARITGKSNSRWNNRENRQPKTVTAKDLVYYDYFITPLTIYKGTLTDHTELRLRSIEGSIGGYTLEDNSQPRLTEGQVVTLLLKNGSLKDFKYDDAEFHTLCGNLNGIFHINGEKLEGQSRNYDKSDFEAIIHTYVNP